MTKKTLILVAVLTLCLANIACGNSNAVDVVENVETTEDEKPELVEDMEDINNNLHRMACFEQLKQRGDESVAQSCEHLRAEWEDAGTLCRAQLVLSGKPCD